jgi:hypothetical protein
LERDLAADVVHLVRLRFLERRGSFAPVRARVHHADAVEPRRVKRLAEAVVGARIGLGLGNRAIREPELVPPVAQPDQRVGALAEVAGERGAKDQCDVAVDVDIAVEVC